MLIYSASFPIWAERVDGIQRLHSPHSKGDILRPRSTGHLAPDLLIQGRDRPWGQSEGRRKTWQRRKRPRNSGSLRSSSRPSPFAISITRNRHHYPALQRVRICPWRVPHSLLLSIAAPAQPCGGASRRVPDPFDV